MEAYNASMPTPLCIESTLRLTEAASVADLARVMRAFALYIVSDGSRVIYSPAMAELITDYADELTHYDIYYQRSSDCGIIFAHNNPNLITASGAARLYASGVGRVALCGNAQATLLDHVTAHAYDRAHLTARDHSFATLHDEARATARNRSVVVASPRSEVWAHEKAEVWVAGGKPVICAEGQSTVKGCRSALRNLTRRGDALGIVEPITIQMR